MEGRPPVGIGHVLLAVSDVNRSAGFWREVGMREIERNAHVAVLELRGGTHLVLVPGTPPPEADAPFDLMVDNLDAIHVQGRDHGLASSPIDRGPIHATFTVCDPDGYWVTVNSSRVVGEV